MVPYDPVIKTERIPVAAAGRGLSAGAAPAGQLQSLGTLHLNETPDPRQGLRRARLRWPTVQELMKEGSPALRTP